VRVVLDTNVLIAAYATRGHCYDVLGHCVRHHLVISSEVLLAELEEKLTRKLRFSRETAEELLAILTSRIEIVAPLPLDPPACRDPDDDWVIATAVAGNCDCIITGDKDLLVLRTYETIAIVSPAEFWRAESAS
jgi:uncharacterized protein